MLHGLTRDHGVGEFDSLLTSDPARNDGLFGRSSTRPTDLDLVQGGARLLGREKTAKSTDE
jgi:hypothetical protein